MSTAQQLQRALEERAKEIEQLNNKLLRAEADRQQWEHQKRVLESKQPQDVQALTRQKRELQLQLKREESEKQELFMQINKLIVEVADLQNKAEASDLPDINRQLEFQVQQLKLENSQLKSKAESVQQKLQGDSHDQKQEVFKLQKAHEVELNRLASELHKYQKEIEVKDAALQSLKLARPAPKDESLEKEVNKLKADLVQRSQENSQLLTQKLELEQFKSNLLDELNQLKSQLARQIQEQKEKQQNSDQKNDEILDIFETAELPSTSSMLTLNRKIVSMKTDANNETLRRKKLETELDQLRQTLNSSNTARQELTRRIEELRDENERLTEKASVEEELHTLMISLREAKSEINAKELETNNWRQKSLKFEEQCDLLQSDLEQKSTHLQKAEKELHSLRSMVVDADILAKLETELRESKQETNKQRQKLHDTITSLERSDAELVEKTKEFHELQSEVSNLSAKLEESEVKRHQLEQKRADEVKRVRDEHRVEVDRMRREFVDDKERIEDRVSEAETQMRKAKIEAEETRKSVEEAQKRLANALNCSPNFDLMLSTINENQQKLLELEQQVNGKENETKLADEIRRLKLKEHELETSLLVSKQEEKRLEDRIRQLEAEKISGEKTERQQLLESDLDELNKMNEELREQSKEQQRLHDTEMRNMRDEMIENIRRLSDLLEAETKRLQIANGERERWSEEAQKWERECNKLREELNNSKHLPNNSSNDSELKELRNKVAELMDENATLAGDLLKLESTGSNGAAQDELRHAQRHFTEEKNRWNKERKELEDKIYELKSKPISPLANGLNGLNGNPTPKPRKLNGNGLTSPRSFSNLASENSSIDETLTNGDDPSKIKSELEKQKRLINVLRKKLQHQQIERVQQSRSFCTS